MDSVDWMTSGVSFNPYQCYLAPLEVRVCLLERERERERDFSCGGDDSMINPLFTVISVAD